MDPYKSKNILRGDDDRFPVLPDDPRLLWLAAPFVASLIAYVVLAITGVT